jgi:hypothetical protein
VGTLVGKVTFGEARVNVNTTHIVKYFTIAAAILARYFGALVVLLRVANRLPFRG